MMAWEVGSRVNVRVRGSSKEVEITIKELCSLSGHGGLMCDLARVKADAVVNGMACELNMMLKQVPIAKLDHSQKLGTQREVQFYLQFPNLIETVPMPWVFRAEFDSSTGAKALLMEDLSATGWVQSGYFYGGHSPLNWGKNLEECTRNITESAGEQASQESITILAFQAAARLHSHFWRDQAILSHSWMRGSRWIQGEDYEGWQSAQSVAIDSWKSIQQALANESCQVTWSSSLLRVIEHSVAQVSKKYFDDFYRNLRNSPEHHWTLVHGDFHPGNMMLGLDSANPEHDKHQQVAACLLDWEMVGVGCGPQDLGQYVISHVEPGERNKWESRALKAYHDELVKNWPQTCKGSSYSMEQCRHDYVTGGIERWIWLLLALSASCPPAVTQYFHDQVAAFVLDHGVTSTGIGAPRV